MKHVIKEAKDFDDVELDKRMIRQERRITFEDGSLLSFTCLVIPPVSTELTPTGNDEGEGEALNLAMSTSAFEIWDKIIMLIENETGKNVF